MASQRTQSSETVEFTYSWYEDFLDRIQAAGYEIRRFADGVDPGTVVIRHDVDLSIRDALRMALLEADRGIATTYCFLLSSALYNPLDREQREQIREIESLGHEIALHFSTHEYWEADHEPADSEINRRVDEERAVLETLVSDPVETVSFHSPPEWVLSRDLADIRNAYSPAYFEEMSYVADSGQRWRTAPPVVGDFGESAQILTHPGLWSESDGSFTQRVEQAVTRSCRHANAKAQREFIPDGEVGTESTGGQTSV
ncbi:polysaccharide deacetylase family protein [Halodesulfurarchaeum formicicum]|uniref:Polysaccharide deacetylase n=1 Tax=Halodesulfurarchaeum formicicum TaxID=1873524 RepID=A0A1J1ABC8_9EURY|nr:hypothetical protein [Halodesulfurarchaeum formicicum]APE95104.1 hypothetical protein HSR6_0644 [Halodesulfurarchaeum formicicum]